MEIQNEPTPGFGPTYLVLADTVNDPTIPGDWTGPTKLIGNLAHGFIRTKTGIRGEPVTVALGEGYGALISQSLVGRIEAQKVRHFVDYVYNWTAPPHKHMMHLGPFKHQFRERVIVELIIPVNESKGATCVRMEASVTATPISQAPLTPIDIWIGVTPPSKDEDHHRWVATNDKTRTKFHLKLDDNRTFEIDVKEAVLLNEPEDRMPDIIPDRPPRG